MHRIDRSSWPLGEKTPARPITRRPENGLSDNDVMERQRIHHRHLIKNCPTRAESCTAGAVFRTTTEQPCREGDVCCPPGVIIDHYLEWHVALLYRSRKDIMGIGERYYRFDASGHYVHHIRTSGNDCTAPMLDGIINHCHVEKDIKAPRGSQHQMWTILKEERTSLPACVISTFCTNRTRSRGLASPKWNCDVNLNPDQ